MSRGCVVAIREVSICDTLLPAGHKQDDVGRSALWGGRRICMATCDQQPMETVGLHRHIGHWNHLGSGQQQRGLGVAT
jgi:hypothetical protein